MSAPADFQPGDRVEYAPAGPNANLRGKHGTVRRLWPAVEPVEGGPAIPGRVGVQFDGHGATWYVPASRLTRIEES